MQASDVGGAPTGSLQQEAWSATPRAILSATAGNFLEFFDFLTYAYFASYIGKAFFPTTNPLTSILLAFATFGVGFLMRPVGAIVIGAYADISGRKPALVLSILLMATGTALVGVVPSYQTLGVLAPILIVLARSMQGFSAGGEWGGAGSFLVEYAPPGRRGLYGSLQQISINAGVGTGTLFGVALSIILTPEQLAEWGWRVPFLIGGLIGPIGLYLRAKVQDTPAFEASRQTSTLQRVSMPKRLRQNIHLILTGFGLTMVWAVSSYVYQIYLPTFLVRELHFSFRQALLSTCAALATSLVAIPIAGALSDRIGRKPLMLGAALGFVIGSYPLFWILVHYPNFGVAVSVQIVAILIYASFCAPAPAAFCELFPTHVRVSGVSIGYNMAVMIFGGFAPFIATYLIAATGTPMAPAFYVIAGSSVSLAVLFRMRETAFTGLPT